MTTSLNNNIKLFIKLCAFSGLFIFARLLSKPPSARGLDKKIDVIDVVDIEKEYSAGDNLLKEFIKYSNKLSSEINLGYKLLSFKAILMKQGTYVFKRIGVGLIISLFSRKSKLIYIVTDLHFKRAGDYTGSYKALSSVFLGLLKKIEIYLWSRSSYVLYNRQDEAEYISKYIDKEKLVYLPLTIIENISFQEIDLEAKTIELIFIGGKGNKPNIAAMNFIINEFLPFLESFDSKKFILHIVGKGWAEEQSESTIKLRYYDFLTDKELSRLYLKVHFAICPLIYGTGLKGKVLEPIKHGKIPIGTDVAFSGLEISKSFTPSIAEYNMFFKSIFFDPSILQKLKEDIDRNLDQKFSLKHYRNILNNLEQS